MEVPHPGIRPVHEPVGARMLPTPALASMFICTDEESLLLHEDPTLNETAFVSDRLRA